MAEVKKELELVDPNDILIKYENPRKSFDNEEMEEFDPTTRGARERETMRRMHEDYETRSLWYVLGTSLLFEGFVLGFASMYFCRKDF